MPSSSPAPFLRAILTLTASLALAVLLVIAGLGAFLLMESARLDDPALAWAIGFGLAGLLVAAGGGFLLGRRRSATTLSLFVGEPSTGLLPALHESREKLAEAGSLLRDARRQGIGRNQAALALRQALDRATVSPHCTAVSPSVQQTLRSLADQAERTAGAAQEERLALLRLSRVLLEASMALHRARGFARPRAAQGRLPVRPRGRPPQSVRTGHPRAVRELLDFLDHRFREQADRN